MWSSEVSYFLWFRFSLAFCKKPKSSVDVGKSVVKLRFGMSGYWLVKPIFPLLAYRVVDNVVRRPDGRL